MSREEELITCEYCGIQHWPFIPMTGDPPHQCDTYTLFDTIRSYKKVASVSAELMTRQQQEITQLCQQLSTSRDDNTTLRKLLWLRHGDLPAAQTIEEQVNEKSEVILFAARKLRHLAAEFECAPQHQPTDIQSRLKGIALWLESCYGKQEVVPDAQEDPKPQHALKTIALGILTAGLATAQTQLNGATQVKNLVVSPIQ